MTLTQMQYFDTLCRYENYTRAAQALFVSQPTISQAIRDLEKECGAPLVCRIGNGLKITPEGEILWEQIRPILRQVRELEAGIAQDGLSRNYIRIGFSTFSGNQVFPQLCRAYVERGAAGGFLPRHLARFNSNIVMLSFPEEEVPQETCLVWKKGVVHSTAVRSFIELAKSCFPKERGSILMASS